MGLAVQLAQLLLARWGWMWCIHGYLVNNICQKLRAQGVELPGWLQICNRGSRSTLIAAACGYHIIDCLIIQRIK
jgi:hypothetical protein